MANEWPRYMELLSLLKSNSIVTRTNSYGKEVSITKLDGKWGYRVNGYPQLTSDRYSEVYMQVTRELLSP